MRYFMMGLYLFLIIFGVSFAVLNATTVNVNLYFTTLAMPVSLLILFVLGLGILIGLFCFTLRYLRLKAEYRKLKNQFALTEKEIRNLRSIPLQDQH